MAGQLLTVEVVGWDAISRRISQLLEDHLPKVVGDAMRAEMEIELTEAQNRTPVDTGALRASGFVSGPESDGSELTVSIGFGGPAVPYAVHVHEDLEAYHKVGQAKFLESTLLESVPHLGNRIAARVQV
jgi:hypothetical protein